MWKLNRRPQLDGASRWQIFQTSDPTAFPLCPAQRHHDVLGACPGRVWRDHLFAGNFPGRTQTMPTAIYLGFERNLDSAITLSVILVVISFVSLLLIKILVSHETD